ncbi:MAG TPA: class I SAM-dependent methyltransferase [Burkholderiales bacterium]|nr:class I SAM-dependent methyltransferase [Burkholderiales bacterium]
MSPDPRVALVERFFRGTGSSYDAVVNIATFGIDRLWKRRIVRMIPPDAGRICDLACGTGISTLAVARAFPRATVVGVELREEYLALAQEKLARLGVTNVELALSRAEDYRAAEPFDCIVSSYLAKYAELPRLVPACRAMLKDGGRILMHDFTFPPGRVRIALFRVYFKALQSIGGALLPQWREIYYGLPGLIEQTRWLPELQAALRAAGFRDVRVEHLTLYGSAIVSARK